MNVSIRKYIFVALGNEPNSCRFFILCFGGGGGGWTQLLPHENYNNVYNYSPLTEKDPGPCSPPPTNTARKFPGSVHTIYSFPRSKLYRCPLTLFRLFQNLHSSSLKF